MNDTNQSGDTNESDDESNFAIYYDRNNTQQMMMVPSTSTLPSNIFESSVEYSYIDTQGNNHNIELGMDIIEASDNISDDQIQIKRKWTLIQHNKS